MNIHNITKTISSQQEGSSVSENVLVALINQYPFASALYAMRSRAQVESGRLTPQDLRESSPQFCNSESFINNCIEGNRSDLQDQFNSIADDSVELPPQKLREVRHESQLPLMVEQALPIKDVSNLPKDIEEPTGQDADQDAELDLIPNDKDVNKEKHTIAVTEEPTQEIVEAQQLKGQADSDESEEKTEKPLLDFAHLSEYGSWLLQLKNKKPKQTIAEPADFMATESIDSPSSPNIDIDQDEEELKVPPKSTQKVDASSRLNDQIASESLANLLAEQGYHKKAIDMYKKLSLILPEKSTYFATQIEKIKRK